MYFVVYLDVSMYFLFNPMLFLLQSDHHDLFLLIMEGGNNS